jgi:hypothetical protein
MAQTRPARDYLKGEPVERRRLFAVIFAAALAQSACMLLVGCVHQSLVPDVRPTFIIQDGPRRSIAGFVADANGVPLNGANIIIEGTELGDATGPAGRFQITNAPTGTCMLTVTHIGYNNQRKAVNVSPDEQTFVGFNLTACTITNLEDGQLDRKWHKPAFTFQDGPSKTVTGFVTDTATGEPLAGVNIQLEASELGTATDGNGEFWLQCIPAGRLVLIASYLGYVGRRDTVDVRPDKQTRFDFDLVKDVRPVRKVNPIQGGVRRR